jgi:hypothetical protein
VALRHFERGLATLATVPESRARGELEIELQLARGLSLFTAKGFEHDFGRAGNRSTL